jgi:hypothetical protein
VVNKVKLPISPTYYGVPDCHPPDIESQAIPPRWPPVPSSLAVAEGVYQLITVQSTSIALVTSRTVKVRVMGLL